MTTMLTALAEEFVAVRADVGIYVDAASTGPYPRRTIDAVTAITLARATPSRALDLFGILRSARARAAKLIGAQPDQIALTPNTSTAVHVAAATLPIRSGSVILGVAGDFPANTFPWIAQARDTPGLRYEQLPSDRGLVYEDAIITRLDRGDVGVLAVSWVSFLTGQRLDLARLGAACKARNVLFFVDAIQGIGATPLDVSKLHIDMLACGAQKWLCSPWGSGFLYVRPELVTSLTPSTGGWLAVDGAETFTKLFEQELQYASDARRFEVATIPYQDFAGFNASAGLFLEVGMREVSSIVSRHATRLIDAISANPRLSLITPRDPSRRAGIISFTARDTETVVTRLRGAQVTASKRGADVLRLSPHFYNTDGEIEALAALLA